MGFHETYFPINLHWFWAWSVELKDSLWKLRLECWRQVPWCGGLEHLALVSLSCRLFLWARTWCNGIAAPQNPSWMENLRRKSGHFHTTQRVGTGATAVGAHWSPFTPRWVGAFTPMKQLGWDQKMRPFMSKDLEIKLISSALPTYLYKQSAFSTNSIKHRRNILAQNKSQDTLQWATWSNAVA